MAGTDQGLSFSTVSAQRRLWLFHSTGRNWVETARSTNCICGNYLAQPE
jgi:hypothetical protein